MVNEDLFNEVVGGFFNDDGIAGSGEQGCGEVDGLGRAGGEKEGGRADCTGVGFLFGEIGGQGFQQGAETLHGTVLQRHYGLPAEG